MQKDEVLCLEYERSTWHIFVKKKKFIVLGSIYDAMGNPEVEVRMVFRKRSYDINQVTNFLTNHYIYE